MTKKVKIFWTPDDVVATAELQQSEKNESDWFGMDEYGDSILYSDEDKTLDIFIVRNGKMFLSTRLNRRYFTIE